MTRWWYVLRADRAKRVVGEWGTRCGRGGGGGRKERHTWTWTVAGRNRARVSGGYGCYRQRATPGGDRCRSAFARETRWCRTALARRQCQSRARLVLDGVRSAMAAAPCALAHRPMGGLRTIGVARIAVRTVRDVAMGARKRMGKLV